MKAADAMLAPKLGLQDIDQREAINLKEKLMFTMLFSSIFAAFGIGVYALVNWVYQAVESLF